MASERENQPQKRASSLDDLEHRLYSRTPPPLRRAEEFGAEERRIRIAPGWTEEAEQKASALMGIVSTIMPWLTRIFIAAIVFFLFAFGILLYGFWQGGHTVSPRNISLSVLGPVSAPAGEELSLEVTVGNYNELPLESLDLRVEYPEGTRKPAEPGEPLLRYREELGALPAGESVSRRLSLLPFGEEGEKKSIVVTVEYRPKESNAIFSRKAEYEFLVSTAPITVSVEAPKEVASSQTFELAFEITSNASSVIRNVLVKAEYPPGFFFEGSAPAAAFSKDTWQLGDMPPEGRRSIRVRGRIEAEEEEERTFRFSFGTAQAQDEKRLGTVFLTETQSIVVKEPFVSLELALNGERGKTFVAHSGQNIRADILFANNLATKIADLEITAKLDGEIWNRANVSAPGGFYDSNTATILWDKRRRRSFEALPPSEHGTESFSFSTLSTATDPARFRNPSMTIHIFARGTRLDEEGVSRDIVSTLSKEIKIASTLALASRLLYGGGPFANTGPMPPRAEAETTYTVAWSLSNSSNALSGVSVRAVLPSYVRFLGEWSPPSEKVEYRSVGGEVVWDAGEVSAGVGFGASPRELFFRVALLPSASQVGSAPTIVGEASAEGEDRFTDISVKSNLRSAQTTSSLSDAGAEAKSGAVTR